MERVKKISKSEHDFFGQYEKYKFEKKQYHFTEYSNNVKREIEKLKSKGYSNCDISVRYFYSIKDYPRLKDKSDEGRESRLLTVVDILDKSKVIYSESFYYDLTYYSTKYNNGIGWHTSVYSFKNLGDLSKDKMKDENLLITNLNNHIEKLDNYYDYHDYERNFVFNKILNWLSTFFR